MEDCIPSVPEFDEQCRAEKCNYWGRIVLSWRAVPACLQARAAGREIDYEFYLSESCSGAPVHVAFSVADAVDCNQTMHVITRCDVCRGGAPGKTSCEECCTPEKICMLARAEDGEILAQCVLCLTEQCGTSAECDGSGSGSGGSGSGGSESGGSSSSGGASGGGGASSSSSSSSFSSSSSSFSSSSSGGSGGGGSGSGSGGEVSPP
jgi:uncharacterized membrane protein YgcG